MRGLNVYCCPSCGHYGFFQLVANAVCPHCSIAMTPLPIPYQDFMDLDYPQRQVLISRHMLNAALPSDTSEPFISPPKMPSHTDLQNKAVSSNKGKSAGKRKSPGKVQSLDNSKSLDESQISDERKRSDENELSGRTTTPDSSKLSGKAKSLSKTKSSRRTRSLNKTQSLDSTAFSDRTGLSDSMVPPDKVNAPDYPVSASSKSHPEISEDSDKETLYQEVLALREKNAQLEQTISWMHDLIWELTRRLHITQNT